MASVNNTGGFFSFKQEVIFYLSPSQADEDDEDEEVASTPPSSDAESGSD